MEDQEKALNLVNLFSPNAISGYSGAGANAVSRADRVFVTTPLSEVVWSPGRGLCFKSADHSLIEKKAPVFWSTEIFNIIISPPPTAGGRNSESDKFMTGGDSTNICHEVAPLGSTHNNVSVQQSCPTWSHEHNPVLKLGQKSVLPGTLQGMKAMKDTSLMNITRGESLPDDKDEGISSHRENQEIANNARASNALNSEVETGSADGRIADCLPHQPEFASNLTKVEAEHESSNKESLREHIERDHEVNNNQFPAKADALIYYSPEFNKWNCTEDLAGIAKSKDGKQAESEDIANEDCCDGQTSHFTCLHSLSETCRRTSDLKECMYPVNQEEKTHLVGPSLDENVTPLDKCKAEEKVSSTERTRSLSKRKDDSNGSVKSGNSAEPFVTGKRTWSFGEDIFMGSKRLKKSSSCSGPHVKKDSSFINWISNVTKGFFGSSHVETHSLATVPNPMPCKQKGLFSASELNDSDSYAAPRTVGFGSILKTFHWPRLTGKSDEVINVHHLGEPNNFKELQLQNLTDGRNTDRANHDSVPQKPVPISRVGIHQGVCQFGEPPPVNDRDHFRDYQSSEDCHRSPLEDQKLTSENSPQYSISPMGLACSKILPADPKMKSYLNPILPSQKSKRLEPMATVFAKRLDAFRHIQTSEVADDMAPESATCLFCGKNGHFITSCSDVTESELEDLPKNTSLGPAQKTTRLCIRCFQHTHWAIACPYASLTSYQHVHGNASIINYESFPRTKGRSDVPLVSNHGVKIYEKSEGRQHQLFCSDRINQEEMSRNVTEFMVQTSILDKKDAVKGKQIVSNAGDAELEDKSFAHFHNLIIKKRPDEQERIFERIRKLRLSRTDVIRWMESSISRFSLEGFFLRVRLGKGEEDQGRTCYHGHLEKKSKEVDELKAWWSVTLQRGGHLPSEVDLDKKLVERAMLDC
ncbi:hypothetical protein Taro_040143 [Colocasia esculenta]|uniref:CCHC-type domain-containing protein n=1 Tax=Colocasia esculenta TaxID=4460 RepID=A0A843WTL1_COLES|nr:hypothetical protein [Colocasia esculenta]